MSQNRREKRQRQFDDLSCLLDNAGQTEMHGSRLVIDGSCHLAMIQIYHKTINTIEDWSDAFLTFAIIYLAAHPDQSQAVLKYFVLL